MYQLPYLHLNIAPIIIDEQNFYPAKEVGAYLELSYSPTQLVKNLCVTDWLYAKREGKRGPPMICVSERGLYKLILEHSGKKKLEFFVGWLCGHVLTSLTAEGKYRL